MSSRILIMLSFLLLGCNSENGVKLNTAGIFSPVTFSINDQNASGRTIDLGERLLTEEPKSLIVKVHNSSDYPYTDLDLIMTADGDNSPSVSFVASDDGEIKFPGKGGTCNRVLPSNATCEIRLQFSPREQRFYTETITLNFKNYVDPEIHVATIKAIAGMPASLTFTNEITQYTFGDLVGTAKTPVVEREDKLTYTQELEIKNAGGLPAKNLIVNLSQTCTSTLTNTCPGGMDNAYSIVSNCPTKLFPNEVCKVLVKYTPKNQDPLIGATPEDIKEINYRSTINFAYIKDPYNGSAALNGYFKSISTNIEARFRVPVANLSFEVPIISGNRDQRSFRVTNVGYREGILKRIDVRDSGGALIAKCAAHETSDFLECKTPGDVPHTLATFPFAIKDKNACLTTSSEPSKVINVGEGCIFDLIFQPSVTFKTDKSTEFLNLQPEVVYDSRWKGNEVIKNQKVFNLSAKSKAAAQLVLDKITFDGVNYTALGNSPWVVNFGRLALQSPSFFKRKLVIVSFKNIGSVEATNLAFKDGSNRAISIGGTPVDLGVKNPKFFTSAIASESNCTVVAPGEICSMTVFFAPIGMDTNVDEENNMFDATGADGDKYKGFQLSFSSGSLYTDENIASDPDLPPTQVEARIKATLIRKGLLMQLADDSRNITGFGQNLGVMGEASQVRLYLRNIGTGPVPYFRFMNPPTASTKSLSLIPTADPASLGADYDCLDLDDQDTTGTVPANATAESRVAAGFAALPKDESCVYTIQFQNHNGQRHYNSTSCSSVADNLEEGSRFFSRGAEASGGTALWEFCKASANLGYANISFQYYDGDSTAPGALSSTYGNRFSLTPYNIATAQNTPAKIIPNNISPFLTATVYRPNFTYPAIPGFAAVNIPEKWFYGSSISFYNILNDGLNTSPFVQGDESRAFVPNLNAYANRTNYDYIYYLGSFPQNSGPVTINLGLRNMGTATGRLTAFSTDDDPVDPIFTVNAEPTVPQAVQSGNEINPLTITFNPTVDGEHSLELNYDYQNGRKIGILNYQPGPTPYIATNYADLPRETISQKVLVVANVMLPGTYPKITMTAQDYDVQQNDGAPPTVTLGAGVVQTLSWNTTNAVSNLVYDTIKLSGTPTANDVYAQKKLTFSNNSGVTLNNLQLLYRTSVTTSVTKNPPATYKIITGPDTTCTNNMTLLNGQSCSVVIRYQPLAADMSDNFVMTMLFYGNPGQYLMQNIGVSLFPRSPGQLAVSGKTTEIINYKVTPSSSITTRPSYPLIFGTVALNVVPKIFSFDQSAAGTFQRLQIINTQTTKASLLLSYQKYLQANSLRGYSPSIAPASSVVPTAGEYRSLNGYDYAPIQLTKYGDGSERIKIEASKGCFFGDDELDGTLQHFQKGFGSGTVTPCYLLVTFKADFSYLNKTILSNNGDDMRGTASELWYYSVNRSSTASMWVHVKGTITPDTSTATGVYSNISSLDTKAVKFSLPKFTPANISVGDVVGIRIVYASSSAGVANPFTTATYVDIRPYDAFTTQFANITAGLANGTFFYFRAIPIRYDARFVDGTPKRFIGLNAGEYLSIATNYTTTLKVLVPPLDHYYFYAQKMVVDKYMTGGAINELYNTSSNRCINRTKMILKDPTTLNYSYQLIKKATWDLLLTTPAATGYANMTQIAHWLGDPTTSIDTQCSALPGFVPNQVSQMLSSSSVFYVRNSSNMTAPVNQAIGGVPGTTNSNYRSFVDGNVGYGGARCMVILP